MHQSVIKVTRWNLKVISLRIPLHFKGLPIIFFQGNNSQSTSGSNVYTRETITL